MTAPPPVPPEAIDAARDVNYGARAEMHIPPRLLRAMLEAAAPAIRADERERMAVPSLVIKAEGRLTEAEAATIKARWQAERDARKNQPPQLLGDPPALYEPVATLVAEAVAAERGRILPLLRAADEHITYLSNLLSSHTNLLAWDDGPDLDAAISDLEGTS